MLGGFIRAAGASKEAKRLQQSADALNPVRPTYQIPEEVRRMLESAQVQAQGDMAGYGRAMGQIQGATANQLAMARNFGSGPGMLQQLALAGEGQRSAMADLNMQNQQSRESNVNAMQKALMDMAGFQEQQFQFNEVEPYMQQEADKRAFQQAAMDQRMASRDAWASVADGAVNAALAIGTAGVGGGQTVFGKLFGGKGAGAVASAGKGLATQAASKGLSPLVQFGQSQFGEFKSPGIPKSKFYFGG